MDGEDEEVIFQNRALHQALYEMGVENIDTEPVMAKDLMDSSNDALNKRTGGVTDQEFVNRIPVGSLTRIFLSQQEITSIYYGVQSRTLKRLKESPLLSSDDRCFLESFISDESVDDQHVPDRHSSPSIKSFGNMLRPAAVALGMLYIFIASLCVIVDCHYSSNFLHLLELYPVCFYCLNLILVLVVLYSSLKYLLLHKLSKRLQEMDHMIQKFEDSADKLSRIERKCIRRIRESELAARGFTLTSLVSTTNSDSSILSQIDKWCPNFRSTLFNGNLDVVGDLEKSYKMLTDSIPLVVDFKWLDIKPSLKSSSSSSSGLNKGSNSSASDADDEEVIPTSKLVSSQELFNIHISAYTRRLVLSFVPKNCKDWRVNPYIAVSESVQRCLESMGKATSLLEKHHSFYRAVHMSAENTESLPVSRPDGKKTEKSPIESFFVFVNSLDLHIQTVFRMTRELTVSLEGLVEGQKGGNNPATSCQEIDIDDTNRQSWTETLKAIKSGLNSCNSCYEEAVKFLACRGNKACPSIIPGPDAAPIPTPTSPKNVNKPMAIIPDADPVIEDQVFEAVTGADEGEVKTHRRNVYTAEEKEQIRQKREDLSRFKQELKAVVDHRAISQRKREEKALARSQGNQKGQSPPTDRTKPASETDGSSAGCVEGDDKVDAVSLQSGGLDEGMENSGMTKEEIMDEGMENSGMTKEEIMDEGMENSGMTKEEIMDEGMENSGMTKEEIMDEQPESEEVLEGEKMVIHLNGKLESEGSSSVNVDNKANDFGASGGGGDGGEKVSLLAAKLDSSHGKCINPAELPWAPLLRSECAPTISRNQPGKSRTSNGHSSTSSLSRHIPYDENWRSSLEKSKARHWEMCERIIQENKEGGGWGEGEAAKSSSDTTPDLTGACGNDLETSSFVDISSDDLLFYPLESDFSSNPNSNSNNEDGKQEVVAAPGNQPKDSDKASSSGSSNSQIIVPKSVNPDAEGFRDVQGRYVSRHHFTASGRGNMIDRALNQIRKDQAEAGDHNGDGGSESDSDKVVHPNRRRHRAGRQDIDLNTSQWVNISHMEIVSRNGNQYELFRQKEMNVEDIASRQPIPSPDPSSSLNTSFAIMAVARSRHFNLGTEEEFIGDGEGDDDGDNGEEERIEDEYSQAINAARMARGSNHQDTIPALPDQL